jgi:hypothetical protein
MARREQCCAAFSIASLANVLKFGMTLYHGRDKDKINLPRQFIAVVEDQHEQVLLWMRGGTTGVWTMEVLVDRTNMMYLAIGWRRFCRVHEITADHFLIFNYDGEHTLTIMVFDETMCRHHYMPAILANAVASSSSEDE